MSNGKCLKSKQTATEQKECSRPGENPLAKALDVTVSVPETLEIRIVDASVLADYEVWFFVSSILASAVVGFLVAYLQADKGGSLLATTCVFAVLFVTSCGMTFAKRRNLRKKPKIIKLRATEIAQKIEK